MNRKRRVVINGLGMIGQQCAQALLKKDVEIVGAVDGYWKIIGKDLGELLGEEKMDMRIESELDQVLEKTHPDIVILCTKTVISEIAEDIKTCIRHRANVITTSEHAYFWQLTDKALGEEIDQMAKDAGVTVVAGGVQDIYWGAIPYALSAVCHSIQKIEGSTLAMVDDFGPAVMVEAYVGFTVEEFNAAITEVTAVPLDAFTISLYALADKLRLHPTDKEVSFSPVIAKQETYCKALNITIPAGHLIGSAVKTALKTEEGIDLSCTFISKLAEEGDTAYNCWKITGNPDMTLKIDDMHGEVTTTSCIIHRLSDVIRANPGFLTINDLPVPYYKAQTFENDL